MKKAISTLVIFFFCICVLCACGDDAEDSVLRDYWLIEPTESSFVTPELDRDWYLLGTHFLNGEAIQIWGQNIRNEQLQGFWDVYVYHEDGSSEFKFGGVSSIYRGDWYMNEYGGFYVVMRESIMKLDSEGQEIFNREYDRTFKTMYQDKKGNWVVLGITEGGAVIISEINAETGELTDKSSIVPESISIPVYYAGQADGIYLLDQQGVWRLNPEEKTKESVFSFLENHYTLDFYPRNFRVTKEGTVELLLEGRKITLSKVNMADRRKILTLCSVSGMPGVEQAIVNFNKENDTYYIVWEQAGVEQSVRDYKEKIGIEIATGGGPDLMFVGGSVSPENIMDYMGKGVFEKLNPYMEQSGISEDTYLPLTFDGLADGEDIYGITIYAYPSGMWVSSEVLGSTEIPTIEELLDALLAYEEKAVFIENSYSAYLLNYFLMASDSLHGAVDWKNGSCNFENNELFRKILQVCLRYEDDRENDYPVLTGNVSSGMYQFMSAEEYKAKGQVPIHYFFDEGNCPGTRILYTIAMNSNSHYKEAAWEFIEYLLNGEIQSTFDDSYFPVKRSGLEEVISREIEEGSYLYYVDGAKNVHHVLKAGWNEYYSKGDAWKDSENYKAAHDITEEKAEEIRRMLEITRTMPVRTEPIITIIKEEASAYFSGHKSIDEVCALIQNRVQLYLDEKN